MTQTPDKIEIFKNALIQHGPLSQRIYLMKIKNAEPAQLVPALNQLAQEQGYTKIFAKIPRADAEPFMNAGYEQEAEIPEFYQGRTDAVFLGFYLDNQRKLEKEKEQLEQNLKLAQQKSRPKRPDQPLEPGAVMRICQPEDAERMAEIYQKVFASYPFPIHEPEYLKQTMNENIIYYGIELDGNLVSLSSAETDPDSASVEMTDFATLPSYRSRGYAQKLLAYMDNQLARQAFKTAYTIARSASAGMNITFARQGYTYTGRLINNTNIAGKIESMNVWHKPISTSQL